MDNKVVTGSSIQINSTDNFGNTYQSRRLENGTTHLVLKNFPSKNFIIDKLSSIAIDIQFIDLEYLLDRELQAEWVQYLKAASIKKMPSNSVIY
ncbi:hypothetical protein [Pedobacter endophyticus]|uniref:Uncharacterized protein n=1 Tax=Pedobacter endophyticus TaxID=2789740 RepID=A0A7U3SQB1_9SPHI|nr:hypothetical protein [Pedobacter endophyticus]QPH38931.1 hypothetical protein IZT61_17980 [Pedobacter endophyticus]